MKKLIILIFVLPLCVSLYGKGELEIGFHYSKWSVNIAKSLIEDNVADAFDKFNGDIGKLDFDSDGNNYGISLRYFPKGSGSSFSIGVSYERNNFKGKMDGSYREYDRHGNWLDVVSTGSFDLTPHSFNFDLRWEIKPSALVHPYIGFGFGIGPQNGNLTLETVETAYYANGSVYDSRTTTENYTLKEAIRRLEDDGDDIPVNFFPVVYVNIGVVGRITDTLYLNAEFAFYDGTIFRGGISYRF